MLAATEPATPHASIDFHVLFHLLALAWPLWVLVAAVGAGKALVHVFKMRRLARAGIFEIDGMSGVMFEQRLAVLFQGLGYRAEIVGSSGGDYGGDLIVVKDRTKTVVQAKCWKQNVGIKAVQEVLGARGYYGADAAMVVTNSRFTKRARELARRTSVQLWGRDELVDALLKVQNEKSVVTAFASEPEPVRLAMSSASNGASAAVAESPLGAVASATEAFCARCGEPVSAKVRAYCLAHPERFKGLVYCYTDQRAFNSRR